MQLIWPGPGSHLQVGVDDLLPVFPVPLDVLGNAGLDYPDKLPAAPGLQCLVDLFVAGYAALSPSGQSERQRQDDGCIDSSGCARRRRSRARLPERCRRRSHQEYKQGERVDAPKTGCLRQPFQRADRIAGQVPWKAGQQVTAQPFRHRQQASKQHQTVPTSAPQAGSDAAGQPPIDRKIGRQPRHSEGNQGGKLFRLDTKGFGNPPQRGHEVAETKAPADGKAAPERLACARAINQPDQNRHGNEQHQPQIERGQGKAGGSAGQGCHQAGGDR